jgi:hypothetical protein
MLEALVKAFPDDDHMIDSATAKVHRSPRRFLRIAE